MTRTDLRGCLLMNSRRKPGLTATAKDPNKRQEIKANLAISNILHTSLQWDNLFQHYNLNCHLFPPTGALYLALHQIFNVHSAYRHSRSKLLKHHCIGATQGNSSNTTNSRNKQKLQQKNEQCMKKWKCIKKAAMTFVFDKMWMLQRSLSKKLRQ